MTDTTAQKSTQLEKTRANGARRLSPPVDIFENADSFLIVADLPGVEPEGLTIEYNPPELHVSARPSTSSSAAPVVYERRFELGSGIDPGAITAELKDGVLRIELKKSAQLRPRRIDVRAA
jgi:HSP20 family protein